MQLPTALRTRVPLIGAPMAGPGGGRLAHAVSRAGGLGMVGVSHTRDAGWIRDQAGVAGADGTAYGVGLMAWALESNPAQLDAVLDLRPALVSVSFGEYAGPVRRLREAGLTTATQVGSLDDLARAEAAGVDVIVARGGEGGGHGRNDLATLPLLQLVLERTDRPVYAAGGLLNHRGLAAVLAAGAAGGWVGTAFLGCVEADNRPAAREALLAADRTGYGRVFDVAQQAPWPREFGGRAVANAYFEDWVGREDELDEAARGRFRAAVEAGDHSVAHVYAGEGVVDITRERTAAEVVAEFARALPPGS
ncbi:NAD(P)H-dependent flavin oxidoreductase [Nocardioides panaciterrulae]|uniref:Nitronate monooxygenase n=1 Tax=Nocardioides panaciterrulae TaxID=661492 RepID=A0A7Y9E4A6_9ACTN|nr:nitronate monooxygenase [Nocardioides panaciterrulae]NYD40621.1 nitronate monooxygenase [Nocardioides panaciterrulae]